LSKAQPYIWASNESGELEKVRPYDLDYRDEIEGDIARTASAFIEANADEDEPFFSMSDGRAFTTRPVCPRPFADGHPLAATAICS
jgi:hypothetical protein